VAEEVFTGDKFDRGSWNYETLVIMPKIMCKSLELKDRITRKK
jgi:hypothetical protein